MITATSLSHPATIQRIKSATLRVLRNQSTEYLENAKGERFLAIVPRAGRRVTALDLTVGEAHGPFMVHRGITDLVGQVLTAGVRQ